MIIYGDPQYTGSLSDFSRCLRNPQRNRDELRGFLIRVGQLEQALEDSRDLADPRLLGLSRTLTEEAAKAFYSFLSGSDSKSGDYPELRNSLRELDQLLERTDLAKLQLTFKIPEGYEFYTLYPEQYVLATEEWLRGVDRLSRVLVVGIRSIGTSLSALVRVVLDSKGVTSTRITVRPTGHPFQRQTHVDLDPKGISHALIVDEGPGLSGSSMASVGEALRSLGIENITLMPGHPGEPGYAGSDEVRLFWATTPRITTPLEALTWEQKSLSQSLCDAAARISGIDIKGSLQNFSAGAWRHFVLGGDTVPAAPFLERTKYLWEPGNGGQKILWKFEGLGSFKGEFRPALSRRSVALILGECNGFTAYEWVEGTRASAGDYARSEIPLHLARYCADSAQSPLAPAEHASAVTRLNQMLCNNSRELLSSSPPPEWHATALSAAREPTYGDGRMGPWEWVWTNTGALIKTDWLGHCQDHTVVGHQSVLWDAAGAIVEWGFNTKAQTAFTDELVSRGICVEAKPLRFYCMAYAAFRAGVTLMANEPKHTAFYLEALKAGLKSI